MKVSEVMHKGVEWVDPDTRLEVLAQRMKEHDIGALPVGENDKLVGMVTDRDIVVRGLSGQTNISSLTARDVMTKQIVYCRDQEEVEDAVRIMEQRKIRRLPVLDKDKRMVGMLSLGDISWKSSRDLTGEVTAAVTAHHH